MAVDFGVLDWPAGMLALSTAFNICRATVRDTQGTKQVLLIEDFAEVLPVFLRHADDGSPLLTLTHRGWSVPCHFLDVADYFEQQFDLCVGVAKLSY
jgi:hypothetical protein